MADDHGFSSRERAALRILVGAFLPASEEFRVPGADDPTIFADILTMAQEHPQPVRDQLAHADGLAFNHYGAARSPRTRCQRGLRAIASVSRESRHRLLLPQPSLNGVVGHGSSGTLPDEEGDWSLLDVVRRRPKMHIDR